jgi:hypothetical protein
VWKLFVVVAALTAPCVALVSPALAQGARPTVSMAADAAAVSPGDLSARKAWIARAVDHILAGPPVAGRSSSGDAAKRPR